MADLSQAELARIKKYSAQKPKSVASNIARSRKGRNPDRYVSLLNQCYQDWCNMYHIREEHRRNQRYKNGKQWGDTIKDPDCPHRYITESEYISRQGRTPITNNLIQQIDRNIQGQMLSNPTQPTVIARSEGDVPLSEMLTNALQKGLETNDYDMQKIPQLGSLLSSGFCVGKVGYGVWDTKNRSDVKISFININKFFFNQDAEDPNLKDVYRLGEVHDLTWNELLRDFYAGYGGDEEALRYEYSIPADEVLHLTNRAEENLALMDFISTPNSGKYRVYEIWQKCTRKVEYVHDKSKGVEIFDEVNGSAYYDAMNEARREQLLGYGIAEEAIESQLIEHRSIIEEYWKAVWLTPSGVCLKEMETPYAHQQHPYVIGCMPRIDGVSKPVYSHLCDTQRTINRHATMIDHALANAAKGLLLVPKSMLATTKLEDITHTWSSSDGVLVFDDTKPTNSLPSQIATSAIPAGTFEFLQSEMNQLKEISGLSGALSGQVARSGTPSSLYAQQAQNSMLNFVVVFECFRHFNKAICEKTLQTIMQYYNTERIVDISGQNYDKNSIFYKPELIEKILDWNITIADATDTPVFRQLGDDMLKYLFEAGAINVEMLLENSSAPYAKKLLAQVQNAKQQAQAGNMDAMAQQMQGVDTQEIQQNVNPQAMQMLQQAMAA